MGKRAGLLLVIIILACTGAFHAWKQCDARAPGLIRLHVVANSNTFYDQELKYQVKDVIVRETAASFAGATGADEARAIVEAEKDRIEQLAREEIRRQGFDYPVRVETGVFYFPVKTYNTRQDGTLTRLTLSPGRYEAVRVIIGSGRGANWWCVMYPPLCFVDSQRAMPPAGVPVATAVEKETLQQQDEQSKPPRIEYRFRIVELLKKWFG